MGRMDRIRQNIVERVIATDDWWADNILQSDAGGPTKQNLIERHLSRQTQGKRRQILSHILELSSRDFQE